MITTSDSTLLSHQGHNQDARCSIVSLFSTKGGVGKSTIAVNLSCLMADRGHKVLLIDADQQNSATNFFVIDEPSPGGTVEFVTGALPPDRCISPTNISGLDLIRSNDPNKSLEQWIGQSTTRGTALKYLCKSLRERYQYIIVDTMGADGRGNMQELAVRASDKILIPVVPQTMSIRETFTSALDVLFSLSSPDPEDVYNHLPAPHMLINRFDSQSRYSNAFVGGIQHAIAEHTRTGSAYLLDTIVPERVVYADAQAQEEPMPVHIYDKKRRKGQKVAAASETMNALADELFTLAPPCPIDVGHSPAVAAES